MSETIKASEITPGMVIEWTDRGTFTRLTVESYNPSLSAVRSVGGDVRYLSSDTEVKVIAAPPVMPTEPETLGARVKAGDNLFLRVSTNRCSWLEVTGGETDLNYTWREVNEFGPVTVIDGDPSWEVESGEDAPEQWDDVEEALKHCDKVVDRSGDKWHYEDSVLRLTMDGTTSKWPLDAQSANNYGPFRRA